MMMRRSLLVAAVLMLVAPPVAYGHRAGGPATDGTMGTVKAYCEMKVANDRRVHDYGRSIPGFNYVGLQDGYLFDCNEDGVIDGDGHAEYAAGGAVLLAWDGDGASAGTIACWKARSDHTPRVRITVTDVARRGDVEFRVSADHSRAPVPFPDCGDNILEPCNPTPPAPSNLPPPMNGVEDALNRLVYDLFNSGELCNPNDHILIVPAAGPGSVNNSAIPVFDPGADGSYTVWLADSRPTMGHADSRATMGHIEST